MEHILIKNGSISKYNTDEQGAYPLQRMRTKNNKVVTLERHFELLSNTYEILFGEQCPLTLSEVEKSCDTLLEKGGYSSSACHILEMKYDQQKNLTVRVIETSPYKEFALRAVRPDAHLFSINCFETTIQTTASVAMTELLRLIAHHYNCDIAACINNSGELWSIDGAAPFVVKGKKISACATIDTVETEMAAATLANLLQYEIKIEEVTIDQAMEADEIFYVDSRGITSVRSIAGHMLSDNVANALFRNINFVI